MIGFNKHQLAEFLRNVPREINDSELKPFILAAVLNKAVSASGSTFAISGDRGDKRGNQYLITGFAAKLVKERYYTIEVAVDAVDVDGTVGFFQDRHGAFTVSSPMSELPAGATRHSRGYSYEFNITAQLFLMPMLIEFETMYAELRFSGHRGDFQPARPLVEHQIYFLDRESDGEPWSFGEPVLLIKQIDTIHIEHGRICDCYTANNRWFHSSELHTVDQLVERRSRPFRNASGPDAERTPPPAIFADVISAYKAAHVSKEGPKE
jgi:hypothetical protein